MNYTNRFFETDSKPENISLPLPIGTVVHDASGLRIITGWGIYDNQYWTSSFDKDGVIWSGEKYYTATEDDVCKSIDTVKLCLVSYVASFERYYQRWFVGKVDKSLFDAHINVFKELLQNQTN